MAVFDRMRGVSERLISKYGQTITWRKNTNPQPLNSAEPWNLNTVETVEYPNEKMVFVPDERDQRETKNYSKRSSVIKGNTTGYLWPVSFTPALQDTVIRGNRVYTVVAIIEVKPNEEQGIVNQVRLA